MRKFLLESSIGGVNHFRKSTNTSNTVMGKRKAGKISVQPEAVKRRRKTNGSKQALIKGMCKKTTHLKIGKFQQKESTT